MNENVTSGGRCRKSDPLTKQHWNLYTVEVPYAEPCARDGRVISKHPYFETREASVKPVSTEPFSTEVPSCTVLFMPH